MKLLRSSVPALVAGALLVGIWYGVKLAFSIPSFLLPAPHEVLAAAWRERRTLVPAALLTFEGAALGFVAAAGLGFLLAAALSLSGLMRRALSPYVLLFQMTPVVILAPIYVLWLGQGLPAIVAITFMICFFPVVASTMLGFASVDRRLVELFVMCGARRRDELRRLRVPAALPHYLMGLKIAGTLAPIGAITGDFLAGSAQNGVGGLGFMTTVYYSQLRSPELFATGLAACLLGFLFVGAVYLLHWRLLRQWHESARPR
ncbi:MAG: ABC transporter permease [Opitutaceae bacterium]